MALYDDISALLDTYGLGSLTDFVISSQKAGKDDLTILTELRQRPEYVARFPAMAEIQKKAQSGRGVAINEGQYLEMERAYRQVFQSAGLPPEMWDSPDDYARLMSADISPVEAQRRVAAAKEAVNSTDPNVRGQLAAMYGITADQLVAYALDPEKGSELIQRTATTARLSGYAISSGMNNLTRDQWEGYAQDLINQQLGDEELRTLVGQADVLQEEQSRLAGIEGSQFTTSDAMDVAVRKDSNKTMASQRRVERERARFSGSQGVGTGSLKGSGI